MTGAPLTWNAGTLDGTDWQGIRFVSIDFPPAGDHKAIVTVHLNRPATGLTADDIVVSGGRHIPPPDHDVLVNTAGLAPDAAVVRFRGFGDHSPYLITLRHGGAETLHPFFASAEFRFAIDCEGGDCRDPVGLPATPAAEAPAVDLLTKDASGFLQLLSDWVKVKSPRMTDLSPASFERMLLDLLAWSGDMHSYFQDRVANEAFIETARQRFSLRQHAILLGSEVDDGQGATTVLGFDVEASGFVPAGLQVRMRTAADEQPVTFTVARRTRVRDANSSAGLRVAAFPDAVDAELPAGATSMLLWGHDAELIPGDRLAIVQRPFSQIVTLTEVRRTAAVGWVAAPSDAYTPGDPASDVTELHWREPLQRAVRPWGAEPLALHANLVDAVYGAPRAAVAGAVPRGGEIPIVLTRRSSVVTRGPGGGLQLRALRIPEWPVIHENGGPAVEVLVSGVPWTAVEHLHASHSFDLHHTASADEAGAVWLGFGDGVEGRDVPLAADGTPAVEIEVRYRVGDPAAGNVRLGTLVEIVRPPTALTGARVTNVVGASGGRAPATLAREREELPQSVRHGDLQRAVTLADYAEVAMQVPGVGRAVARSGGGLFNTVLVLVDPEAAEELGEELREQLHAHVDTLRMTGREHVVLPAEYVPLHVALELCVEPGFAKHLVRDSVLAELRPGTREQPGFFHPDRLSFGDTVRLGDVLALVQGIAGVRSVRATIFRPLLEFDDPQVRDVIRLGGTRVARLDADPDFPEDGILVVDVVGLDHDLRRTVTPPAEWRVTAVTTEDEGVPQHRIVEVGGMHPDGTTWRMTVPEAITAIERGQRLYVERPVGDAVDVVVSHTGAGRRYLRTVADGDEPNNLLALPPLPDE